MEITLPSLHTGQQRVRAHQARFKVLACGRRWGKTRLGTVLCISEALQGRRTWWVAPTYKMGVVGWRGIERLAAQIPGMESNKSERIVTFGNGSAQVRSADDPNSLRGDGLDGVVMDECAYIKSAAWYEALRPALSDRRGWALFISTPHGMNWFRDLWKLGYNADFSDWASWSFKTSDNPFIDKAEIEAARRTMSSRVFRQEYEADFLEDNPGALWRREWIDDYRVTDVPDLARVIVAVDPSITSTGDECGIVCAGFARNGNERELYVLEDVTLQGGPSEWARAAIALYHKMHADCIVAESNQGGEMVTLTLKTVDSSVPVKLVHASRGKHTRAEPVSAIYEQGRGHHVGTFAQLEDELCQWEPGDKSPNRLDALVWAATELIPAHSTIDGQIFY